MDNQFLGTKQKMLELLSQMRSDKPEERSELSRRVAVAITEMEKVVAYWSTYVAGSEFDNPVVK